MTKQTQTAAQLMTATRAKAKAKAAARTAKAAKALETKALAAAKAKTLDQLQASFVTATINGEGSTLSFATGLNAEFGKGWQMVALSGPCSNPNEKALRDNIKARKASLYEALKAKGHTNPSVVWSRVIKAAAGPKPKGAKANAPRAIDVRQREDCSKVFAAFFRADDCSPKAVKFNEGLAALLVEIYGVDIAALKS